MDELTFDIVSFILGSVLTLIITYITEKGNEARERRNLFISFISNNKVLLQACIENNIGKDINYSELRKEINENIISYFALSKEYKNILFNIYKYINFSGDRFVEVKPIIKKHLEELYKKLEGDEVGIYKD